MTGDPSDSFTMSLATTSVYIRVRCGATFEADWRVKRRETKGLSGREPNRGVSMRIEVPRLDEIDAVVEQWVSLAFDQRQYGSHLEASTNRATIRESFSQHAIAGGILVARAPDLVGFVTFSPELGSYDQDVSRGVIENLYVQADRRGEGIGSKLLSAAESALADAGADVISLEAMAANDDARRFYERHGYVTHRVELEKSAGVDARTGGDG